MPKPIDVASIRRFIGFTNYLSKYLPRLSDVLEPLGKLTLSDVEWFWVDIHDSAIQEVKLLIMSMPVLKYFDPAETITWKCDASDKGLEAVLLQKAQPIAYVSQALTDMKTHYAQIEKGLLAVVYGVEKFHTRTNGRWVFVELDHKPLEVIFK